jgi:hypothetical protein
MNLSHVRKTLINILTIVVTAGPWILKAMNVFPGSQGTAIATVLSAVLGLFAAVLHYLVPNTTTDPTVAATQSVRLVDGVQPRAGVKHQHPHAG